MKHFVIMTLLAIGLCSCQQQKETGNEKMVAASSMTKSEKEEIYTLSGGDNTMIISASKGGRIISLMNKGKEILLSSEIHDVNYGATLWPSPQKNWGWPPYPVLDTEPYDAEYNGQQLILKSRPDTVSGFQFEKKFSVSSDSSIDIQYRIRNISGQEKQVAAWDVCRTDGGISFFPIGEEAAVPANTLEGIHVEDGILWYDFNAGAIPKPQKLFSTAKEGWLAHISGGLLFIKKFPDTNIASLPPDQGEVEIFAQENGLYIELENHGPYTTLEPGEALLYDQIWYLQPIDPALSRSEWVHIVRKRISE